MARLSTIRALARCEKGGYALEFALISPAFCTLLLGTLDVGHTFYMQGVLQGAVQKAARDGTLEQASGSVTAQRDAIDQIVRNQLGTLHKTATITVTRRFYRDFTKAAAKQAESFTDSAVGSTFRDGKCNNSESYVDANNNGVFDRDGGDSVERAGARDNIVYTVTITYPRVFPVDKFIGGKGTTTLSAETVLANQPYGDQGKYAAPTVDTCGVGSPGVDAPS